MIRAKLAEVERRLDHGLSLNDLGELQRMPADLDRAVTLRQHHWQVLGALLTEAEVAPCGPPADQPPPACPPAPIRRNSIMERPAIVIRDIRRHGDDPAVPGDRVALEHTDDPHTRLRPGDEGTVTRYDPRLGRLDVSWDNGSTLAMLLNDGDRVRLIAPAPGTGAAGKEPAR